MINNSDKYRYGELRWEKVRTEFQSKTDVRLDIIFNEQKNYGGLHCGDCLDIFLNGEWISTRVELAEDWYLVGIKRPIEDLINKDVRISRW